MFTRPEQLVLCVSERSLLPVLVSGRNLGHLVPRFRDAVVDQLQYRTPRQVTRELLGSLEGRLTPRSSDDLCLTRHV
jgi:hypothetical protein